MALREFLHPRRIQECFSCCPTGITTYAMVNLDSIGKLLNHLLMLMAVFNLFLFFSSWNVSFLPTMGFNTVLVSFLLCCQNVVVWLILNNNRISALSFLAPTEFMVGMALGITIGGSILAFVISGAFRKVSECNDYKTDQVYEYICGERKGSMNAVWFWSGLVFWLNFCASLLIAIGRHELTQQGHYENLGLSMDDYEDHFHRHQQGGGLPSDMPTPTPSYVGNYDNVPEVRSGGMEETSSLSSNGASRSRSASLSTVPLSDGPKITSV